MPPQAYALVTVFAIASVGLGLIAVRGAALIGGPVTWRATMLPIAAAFGALYIAGHRFGLVIGPEIELFGFRVALLGDLGIGLVAALVMALVQLLVLGRLRRRARPG